MDDVAIIEDAATAAVALDPVRSRLLAGLAEPASAAALAGRLGLPRQKVNYHLKALEAHGLVAPAGEKTWGGLTERRFVATAGSYLVSPAALGPLAADPGQGGDAASAGFLVALAGRAIREVGAMLRRARDEGLRLGTLSLDLEIAFRTPADRAAFAADLAAAVAQVAARYHDPAPGSRTHRLTVLAHPIPQGEPR